MVYCSRWISGCPYKFDEQNFEWLSVLSIWVRGIGLCWDKNFDVLEWSMSNLLMWCTRCSLNAACRVVSVGYSEGCVIVSLIFWFPCLLVPLGLCFVFCGVLNLWKCLFKRFGVRCGDILCWYLFMLIKIDHVCPKSGLVKRVSWWVHIGFLLLVSHRT